MKLSLSVRMAKKYEVERDASLPLEKLAALAISNGYKALCLRASQMGAQTPLEEVRWQRRRLGASDLTVSMVTGNFPILENTNDASDALCNITPYLDLADTPGANLLRIGLKHEDDIECSQRTCDEAGERSVRLAHQSHTRSLFKRTGESDVS